MKEKQQIKFCFTQLKKTVSVSKMSLEQTVFDRLNYTARAASNKSIKASSLVLKLRRTVQEVKKDDVSQSKEKSLLIDNLTSLLSHKQINYECGYDPNSKGIKFEINLNEDNKINPSLINELIKKEGFDIMDGTLIKIIK